ncbi:MAG: DUF2971 domain-containing protein [Bacteroidota bacterium]|nr:DUF2971 domain-containing protein [Bacteroidota bacterium]
MTQINGPTTLYKYRRFDELDLRLITHSEIWFSCAKPFNDPFDTSLSYNYDDHDGKMGGEWTRWADKQINSHLSPQEREKIRLERLSLLKNPKYLEKMRNEVIEYNYNKFGICPLARRPDNLLLWAHYSEKHTGFCVGISTSKLDEWMNEQTKENVQLDRLKVKYRKQAPNYNFFEVTMRNDIKHIASLISTKFKDWSYEEEWRLVLWERVDEAKSIGYDAITIMLKLESYF